MDHLSILLPMVNGDDRIRCMKRLQEGKISWAEFMDNIADLALENMMNTLHLHKPHLPTPDISDPNVDLPGFISGIQQAVAAGQVEYEKIMSGQNVKESVNIIFNDWERLRCMVSNHAKALGKRWSKKDGHKRRALLLKAWPNMSSMHRPDFNVIRYDRKGPAQRDALMMPHINLEDLS